MLTERCIKLNQELPKEVCLHLFPFKTFPTFMDKLTGVWDGIVTPQLAPQDKVPWIFASIKYFRDLEETEPAYIIWFFLNDSFVTDEQIIGAILEYTEGGIEDES